MKIPDYRILSSRIEKYKPALSKSDSSWDNWSYNPPLITCLLKDVGVLYYACWCLLRIDKASLLETFSGLRIRNFVYTPSCLQLLKKPKSNFILSCFYSSFSCFWKSLAAIFRYFCAISLQLFIIFLDSTKRKIVWIKITIFFKRHVSIILWSFSS